jgi:signal transduction histidine kinase
MAVEYALGRSGLRYRLDCGIHGRYRQELEVALYFCCVEALQNAAKHAGPTASLQVSLAEVADSVVLRVTDDGVGFTPNRDSGRSGLQNIADRIGAVGGTVTVESEPGNGVRVCASVPRDAPSGRRSVTADTGR